MSESRVPIRLLLCDDTPDIVELLSVFIGLEPDMQVVATAGDGAEGIAEAQRVAPDVVILDVAMPRMDGLEALPHLLALEPAPRVVMYTAFAEPGLEQRALAAGAAAVVIKGSPPKELVAAIRDALDR